MFKRLREEWLYWKYRNITRRWLLLRPRLRARRQPHVGSASRARGTAMYMQTRSTSARGLLFVVVAAAVLAVVNTLLGAQPLLDIVLFVAMAYGYTQYSGL